jgi:hypothetical protein
MKRNSLFLLIAALLLAPWPVVYAFDGVMADNTASVIQPADCAFGPQFQADGKITPGGLFIVDLTGVKNETSYQLTITNANELASIYRFLNIKIGIFVQGIDANHWNRLTAQDGEALRDIYITMFSGVADFTLPGGAIYKVAVDTGRFDCGGTVDSVEAVYPVFCLSSVR